MNDPDPRYRDLLAEAAAEADDDDEPTPDCDEYADDAAGEFSPLEDWDM